MKTLRNYLRGGALLAALGLAKLNAVNSVLTFDLPNFSDYAPIPSTYGSNLANTPNVTVSYRSIDPNSVSSESFLSFWSTGFGNLTNIAYAVAQGFTAEVTFTAAPGFNVNLDSFDLASFGFARNAQTLRILDGSFNTLLDYSPLSVPSGNTHLTFSPNLTGSVLRIQWGPDFNVGIDNISFGQSAVTVNPRGVADAGSAAALLGFALVGLGYVSRRFATDSI